MAAVRIEREGRLAGVRGRGRMCCCARYWGDLSVALDDVLSEVIGGVVRG